MITSIGMSGTSEPIESMELEDGTGKRGRGSDDDPESEGTLKKSNVTGSKKDEVRKTKATTSGPSPLDRVIENIEQIKKATSRESGGKIHFNNADLKLVKDACADLYRVFSEIQQDKVADKAELARMRGLLDIRDCRGVMTKKMLESQKNLEERLRKQEKLMERLEAKIDGRLRPMVTRHESQEHGDITDRDNLTGEGKRQTTPQTRQRALQTATLQKPGTALGAIPKQIAGLRQTRDTSTERAELTTDTECDRIDTTDGDGREDWSYETVTYGRRKKSKKTYADMAKLSERRRTENRPERQGWKTPPPLERTDTTIMVNKPEDITPTQAVKIIRETVVQAKVTGTVKSVTALDGGSILINCKDNEQQEQIRKAIQQCDGPLRVKENRKVLPSFVIVGVMKCHTAEELMEELWEQNPNLIAQFGEEIKKTTRPVNNRPHRNPLKINWVLECEYPIFRHIMKEGTLKMDMADLVVEERIMPAMCFRCCGFGHVAKYCRAKDPVCHKCAGAHEGKMCPGSTRLNCPNCLKMRFSPRSHSARDVKCPVMAKRIDLERRTACHATEGRET